MLVFYISPLQEKFPESASLNIYESAQKVLYRSMRHPQYNASQTFRFWAKYSPASIDHLNQASLESSSPERMHP